LLGRQLQRLLERSPLRLEVPGNLDIPRPAGKCGRTGCRNSRHTINLDHISSKASFFHIFNVKSTFRAPDLNLRDIYQMEMESKQSFGSVTFADIFG